MLKPRLSNREIAYSAPKGVQADLYGNKATVATEGSNDGNVVLGFTSNTYLMLDIDFQEEDFVIAFAIQYAKFHKLGSVLILKSSEDYLTDLRQQVRQVPCYIW